MKNENKTSKGLENSGTAVGKKRVILTGGPGKGLTQELREDIADELISTGAAIEVNNPREAANPTTG